MAGQIPKFTLSNAYTVTENMRRSPPYSEEERWQSVTYKFSFKILIDGEGITHETSIAVYIILEKRGNKDYGIEDVSLLLVGEHVRALKRLGELEDPEGNLEQLVALGVLLEPTTATIDLNRSGIPNIGTSRTAARVLASQWIDLVPFTNQFYGRFPANINDLLTFYLNAYLSIIPPPFFQEVITRTSLAKLSNMGLISLFEPTDSEIAEGKKRNLDLDSVVFYAFFSICSISMHSQTSHAIKKWIYDKRHALRSKCRLRFMPLSNICNDIYYVAQYLDTCLDIRQFLYSPLLYKNSTLTETVWNSFKSYARKVLVDTGMKLPRLAYNFAVARETRAHDIRIIIDQSNVLISRFKELEDLAKNKKYDLKYNYIFEGQDPILDEELYLDLAYCAVLHYKSSVNNLPLWHNYNVDTEGLESNINTLNEYTKISLKDVKD